MGLGWGWWRAKLVDRHFPAGFSGESLVLFLGISARQFQLLFAQHAPPYPSFIKFSITFMISCAAISISPPRLFRIQLCTPYSAGYIHTYMILFCFRFWLRVRPVLFSGFYFYAAFIALFSASRRRRSMHVFIQECARENGNGAIFPFESERDRNAICRA